MKIGIIGAGNIGRTIGKKWAAAGHDILFGARDLHSPKLADLPGRLGQTAEAIAHGEVLLIAVPGAAVAGLASAFAAGLDGKLLIDATNNLAGPEMHGVSALAARAPAARIFRAFNTLGWENFEEPWLAGQQIDLFFCGPDDADRAAVEGLIQAVGLRPVYVGGRDQLPLLDNLTRLWFTLAMGRGHGRRIAFKALLS